VQAQVLKLAGLGCQLHRKHKSEACLLLCEATLKIC